VSGRYSVLCLAVLSGIRGKVPTSKVLETNNFGLGKNSCSVTPFLCYGNSLIGCGLNTPPFHWEADPHPSLPNFAQRLSQNCRSKIFKKGGFIFAQGGLSFRKFTLTYTVV